MGVLQPTGAGTAAALAAAATVAGKAVAAAAALIAIVWAALALRIPLHTLINANCNKQAGQTNENCFTWPADAHALHKLSSLSLWETEPATGQILNAHDKLRAQAACCSGVLQICPFGGN